MVEKLLLNGNGHQIPAVFTLPEGDGKFPAVVMMHGTNSQKDEMMGSYIRLAKHLAENGIASIRFDFVGYGESMESFADYNYTNAVKDAVVCKEYLQAQSYIDPDRIGVVGWSQGGSIALQTAGKNPDIKSVVTWAGAYDMRSLVSEDAYADAKKKGYTAVMHNHMKMPIRLGLSWMDEVLATNVLEVFSHSAAPILAIHGDEDPIVPYKTAEEIVAVSKNPRSRVLTMKGHGHIFGLIAYRDEEGRPVPDYTGIDQVITYTTEFFSQTL